MSDPAAPHAVDARGMRCPWPVLRAARSMRDHAAIEIRADDPRAAEELRALAAERGWSFMVSGNDRYRLDR